MSGVLERIQKAVCPTDGLNSSSPSCDITETSSLPEDQLRCMFHMMENELKIKPATDGAEPPSQIIFYMSLARPSQWPVYALIS